MPDYKRNDPKDWGGDPTRGAALGRPAIHRADTSKPVKFTLRRSPLDSGGYDRNGTYFGTGQPLYWYAADDDDDDNGEIDAVLRADNREHAKQKIRAVYPKAKFYR